jgi:4'-phosphopantetheinyl transferase
MRALLQFLSRDMDLENVTGGIPARDRLQLAEHDVDVWRIALDNQPPEAVRSMSRLLSADETERASRFFFERDRVRYIVGRAALRMVLGRYLGRRPKDLIFRYGANGKPSLVAGSGSPVIHFNVAHSEGLALFAFTRVGEVGIDLEWMRDLPDWEQVAEAAFSTHELAQLRACPPERRRDEFFRSWTRQEAVLKALGTGLANTPDAAAESAFHVYPLDVAPGYAAAFAAAPGVRRPRPILEWQSSSLPSEASPQHFRFNPTSPT